jgi:ADP-ribosyl-[dinitrogen reductase] hydrolase
MTSKDLIIGAISGDIIGSVFEWHNVKSMNFDLFCKRSMFTDDSVLTLATMYALINNADYSQAYHTFGKKFPNAGYGPSFRKWISSNNPKPYNSWGNGSAMRVSPIGWFFNNIDDTLLEAKKSAEVSHNHPEGIKGAQATAAAIFMARNGKAKMT